MSQPTVHILLASFNGQLHLAEQLLSFINQTYSNWTLTVSDDGSTDETRKIVEQFAVKVQQPIKLISGPCKGPAQNFFHLLNSALSHTAQPNDLYAFSDQDDVWLPEKLARAVTYHQQCSPQSKHSPILYCARVQIVDEKLRFLSLGLKPSRPLSFGNALVQNIAGGNTMVFNRPLLAILQCLSPAKVLLHDWITYQVATACSGKVHFDPRVCLLYRQHNNNIVGANTGWKTRALRISALLKGQHKQWANHTEASLAEAAHHFSHQSKNQYMAFKQLRRATTPLKQWELLFQARLYRQTLVGQFSLIFAVIFKLI
jgi:glycosyltransferase involved in cell wall biosynthesis